MIVLVYALIPAVFYIQLDAVEHGVDPNLAFYTVSL